MAVEGQFDKERAGVIDPAAEDAATVQARQEQERQQQEEAVTDPDDVDGLRNALADMRKQMKDEKDARQAADTARVAAEQDAQRSRQQAATGQNDAFNAQYNSISRTLEAVESKIKALSSERRAALQSGDYDAEEKANLQLAELSAQKIQLVAGKQQMEVAAKQRKDNPQQPRPVSNDPFEQAVAQYSPRTQLWIRQHPQVLANASSVALAQAAHFTAVAAGHVADSDAYFDAMDQTLGFKQAPGKTPTTRGGMATPPARGGTPGARQDGALKVEQMSPAMLQLAKESELKPEEWLKYYNEAVASGDMKPLH